MVTDAGHRHYRRWWRLELHCAGCGQQWPCYVALARTRRRYRTWA